MSLTAQIVNGEMVSRTTETTSTGNTNVKSTADANSSLDKDAFLQLLVAQMKYQDPLEPTSNTEYISQFTTFSELEQMQNMSSSMDLQRASNLVGQYVLINHESEVTGEASQVMGKVDYVFYEGGKPYLHVNNGDYTMDELDSIIDASYFAANGLSTDFISSLSKLPLVSELTTGYADVIHNLRSVYNDMNDYQRSFIPVEYVNKLSEYENKLQQLLAAESEDAEA